MQAEELLEVSRQLASSSDRRLGATRLVAAALLIRQALEMSLDHFWKLAVPGMESVSARAQLVSLPYYLNGELAADVVYTWYRLSVLCHRDAYDMTPAPEEVASLSTIVSRLQEGTGP